MNFFSLWIEIRKEKYSMNEVIRGNIKFYANFFFSEIP